MSDYPVVFRCADCTIEAPTLALLESHIWSRHLRTFPYKCALCSYPALTHSALYSHFDTAHPTSQNVEFKRLLSDEVKLRELIASSIAVPLYEEDDDQMYERNGDSQTIETVEEGVVVDENGVEVGQMSVDQIGNQELVDQNNSIIYMDIKPVLGPYSKHNMIEDEQMQMGMPPDNPMDIQMMENNGDLIDGDDDTSYAVYSDHELLDEGYEYFDEHGNTIYVPDQYPTTSKNQRNMRMRVEKDRHMDMVVSRVATSDKPRRPSTIWECPDCGKFIKYPSRIAEHRRSHAGVKPYACTYCGQKFSHKGVLKCHIRIHTGEKPYACTWDCGKTFVSASAQRMHEKLHSGERPFRCDKCGRLFGKRSHLVRHEKAVHDHVKTIDPKKALYAEGLDAAGDHEDTLKSIVYGVVDEVRQEKYEKTLKKEPR